MQCGIQTRGCYGMTRNNALTHAMV